MAAPSPASPAIAPKAAPPTAPPAAPFTAPLWERPRLEPVARAQLVPARLLFRSGIALALALCLLGLVLFLSGVNIQADCLRWRLGRGGGVRRWRGGCSLCTQRVIHRYGKTDDRRHPNKNRSFYENLPAPQLLPTHSLNPDSVNARTTTSRFSAVAFISNLLM